MSNQRPVNTIDVNLAAMGRNYNKLKEMVAPTDCAGVVKCDAYGLGMEPVTRGLMDAGCNNFFVATLDEAIEMRLLFPDTWVGFFHGVITKEEAVEAIRNHVVPCLSSRQQVELWRDVCEEIGFDAACVFHIDTGMNRLGIDLIDIPNMFDEKLIKNMNIHLVMTHLACASEPEHSITEFQLHNSEVLREFFKAYTKFSISASSGMFNEKRFHRQIVRAGAALYGINPTPNKPNPMENVVNVSSYIIQLRELGKNDFIGYNATAELPKGSLVATIPVGYGDGILRCLSNRGYCAINAEEVPIVGRVSMDLITLDVTKLKDQNLQVGERVEVIGDTISVDKHAEYGKTIGYEVLTKLGKRYKRCYSSDEKSI